MTTREKLHLLVDQLTAEKVDEVLQHVQRQLGQQAKVERPVRQLSFVGIIHEEPDFAERSEEILRELGRTA
ncbi:MAG: hypothetical protein ACRDPW_07265 [Mycobacteriales bacterium]